MKHLFFWKVFLLILSCTRIGCEQWMVNNYAGNGKIGFSEGASMPNTDIVPTSVWSDTSGVVYFGSYYRIGKLSPPDAFASYYVTTYAGSQNSYEGSASDGIPANSKRIGGVTDIWGDSLGNLYYADPIYYKIFKVSTSKITTNLVGSGCSGNAANNSLATASCLNYVYSLTGDTNGNLYFGDSTTYVRKYSPNTLRITNIIGSGSKGFSGDLGPATQSMIGTVMGIAVDTTGIIFIVDQTASRIRKVGLSGIITTIAGTGNTGYNGDGLPATNTNLFFPFCVFVDTQGILYTADYSYRIIKLTTDGIMTGIAGKAANIGFSGDGGPPTSATLGYIVDIWIDSTGTLFAVDDLYKRIRKFSTAGSGSSITIYGGTGSIDSTSNGGSALSAKFMSPLGIWIDSASNLYIPDFLANWATIRKVNPNQIISTFGGIGPVGAASDGSAASSSPINSLTSMWGDPAGNIFFMDNQKLKKIDATTKSITTLAGGGSSTANNVAGSSAWLNNALSLTGDTNSKIYMSWPDYHVVRTYTIGADIISTFAGTISTTSPFVDNVPATSGTLNVPFGIWIDSMGTLFITDQYNFRVRKVKNGIISTIAGNGISGYTAGTNPGLSTRFNFPYSVVGDTLGNIYLADAGNKRIYKLFPTNTTAYSVMSVAGTGNIVLTTGQQAAAAADIFPMWISIDTMGSLYMTENRANWIRKLYFIGSPSSQPSSQPTSQPTLQPTRQPTGQPSMQPTSRPGIQPSSQPSAQPTMQPSCHPSSEPSSQPSNRPSCQPSSRPSSQPSCQPVSRPSTQPSSQPSCTPSTQPTIQPSAQPVIHPSSQPTGQPSVQPFSQPTSSPTRQPTSQPSSQPISIPSAQPSSQPTSQPTLQPSRQPTGQPSMQPTSRPTARPSSQPSAQPSSAPTGQPSAQPSNRPSCQPSSRPSSQPSCQPVSRPSTQPSSQPSCTPSTQPTIQPSAQPVIHPSSQPTGQPSVRPFSQPTSSPTRQPTSQPSSQPISIPSAQPSAFPTGQPSTHPTALPTSHPSSQPSLNPSSFPSDSPSSQPTAQPSSKPSSLPSLAPSGIPTTQPTKLPSSKPSSFPSSEPSSVPSSQPSSQPSVIPSREPSCFPSSQPSAQPSLRPTTFPSGLPTSLPSSQPTLQPTTCPTSMPTVLPSTFPSSIPSRAPSSIPSNCPSASPTNHPTVKPSTGPSRQPTGQPSSQPSTFPTAQPTSCPSRTPNSFPSSIPTHLPSGFPSVCPSSQPTVLPSLSPASHPSLLPLSFPTSSPSSAPTRQPSSRPTQTPSCSPSSYPTSQPSTSPSTQRMTLKPSVIPTRRPTATPSISRSPTSSGEYLSVNITSRFQQSLMILGRSMISNSLTTSISKSSSSLGSCFMIFGSKQGSFPDIVDLGSNTTSPTFQLTSVRSTLFSDSVTRSLTNPGDVDGDSLNDLLIGDPINSKMYFYRGIASNDRTQSFQLATKISGATYSDSVANLGWSSAGLGDLTGDGRAEFIISAPGSKICYVFYGRQSFPTNLLIDTQFNGSSSSFGFRIVGSSSSQYFGMAIDLAGDFDGDGTKDIVISAMGYSSETVIYILLLSPSLWMQRAVRDIQIDQLISSTLSSSSVVVIYGTPFSFAGVTVAGIGDLNSDGFDDILVGSIPYQGGFIRQRSYVIFGTASTIAQRNLSLSSFDGRRNAAGFVIDGGGFVVAGPGDVNGDGIADAMVCDYQDWLGKSNAYLLLYPENVPSPPTLFPSSSPSFPPTARPTSLPSVSLSPTPQLVTDSPTLVNSTRSPTILRTNRPTLAPRTTRPSPAPSKRPSPLPSRRPSTAPTIFLSPSPLPSRRILPSISPTLRPSTIRPSAARTNFPSSFPSYSASTSTRDVFINSTGVYENYDGKTQIFILSSAIANTGGTVRITGGTGPKIYTIFPLPSSLSSSSLLISIVITDFQNQKDLLDLSYFKSPRSLSAVSYSTNPLIIFLSQHQVILLPSHSSMDLKESNFLFSTATDTQSQGEGGDAIVLDSSLQVPLIIFLVLMFVVVFCGCMIRSNDKRHNRSYQNSRWEEDRENDQPQDSQQRAVESLHSQITSLRSAPPQHDIENPADLDENESPRKEASSSSSNVASDSSNEDDHDHDGDGDDDYYEDEVVDDIGQLSFHVLPTHREESLLEQSDSDLDKGGPSSASASSSSSSSSSLGDSSSFHSDDNDSFESL